MKPLHLVVSVLMATASCGADESGPKRPSPAQIATLLGVDEAIVSIDDKPTHKFLVGVIIWRATYLIAGEERCSLTITVFPDDCIIFLDRSKGIEKIVRDDGDVAYHNLRDSGHKGAFYETTLLNHENDWDMTLTLSRDQGVDESKLPVAIATAGISLIGPIEAVLRNSKPQQVGSGQPASVLQSKPQGDSKAKPESEVRPRINLTEEPEDDPQPPETELDIEISAFLSKHDARSAVLINNSGGRAMNEDGRIIGSEGSGGVLVKPKPVIIIAPASVPDPVVELYISIRKVPECAHTVRVLYTESEDQSESALLGYTIENPRGVYTKLVKYEGKTEWLKWINESFRNDDAEQGGADQPTTAPESEPENSPKLKPESEARPQ